MATDKTEVPVRSVIGIGLLSIGLIVAVHQSIWGYYYSMYGDEQQRKSLGVASGLLERERSEEAARLSNVSQAMQQVAASVGTAQRPAAITPRASTDLQALQGWGQRPRVVPNPPPAQGDPPAGADTNAPAAAPTAPAAAPTALVAPTAAAVAPAHPAPVAPAAAHPAPTTAVAPH
jgi:hypothetical protein